ncbi:MAG: redox-regulated ATPase YchF [Albidovulum sp.]|nr:redox-regulated ATPase YchF [Albidovulum sp.]
MGFQTGIVGLPNVGKSTLFNALTRKAAAQAANFPFCTIEPNLGEVAVPDPRLDLLAKLSKSPRTVPAKMTFVDIAGLVKGASKGEGLGNKFLAGIREVDAIVHVLRCFEDEDVAHVSGAVDPAKDADIVETELMLADLASIERRLDGLARKLKGGDPDARERNRLLRLAGDALENGNPARTVEIEKSDAAVWRSLHLLSAKPLLYVANVGEDDAAAGNELSEEAAKIARKHDAGMVVISALIEEEISQLNAADSAEMIEGMGMESSGLERLIDAGFDLLGLITFFTAGAREARAWTIPRGTMAVDAAGCVHNDMRRGFIRAETISLDELAEYGGEQGAREAGKMRSEGRTYKVEDGDVLRFLFNV